MNFNNIYLFNYLRCKYEEETCRCNNYFTDSINHCVPQLNEAQIRQIFCWYFFLNLIFDFFHIPEDLCSSYMHFNDIVHPLCTYCYLKRAWKKSQKFRKRQKMTKPEFQKWSSDSVLNVEPKQNQFWNLNSMRFKIEALQSWKKNWSWK